MQYTSFIVCNRVSEGFHNRVSKCVFHYMYTAGVFLCMNRRLSRVLVLQHSCAHVCLCCSTAAHIIGARRDTCALRCPAPAVKTCDICFTAQFSSSTICWSSTTKVPSSLPIKQSESGHLSFTAKCAQKTRHPRLAQQA